MLRLILAVALVCAINLALPVSAAFGGGKEDNPSEEAKKAIARVADFLKEKGKTPIQPKQIIIAAKAVNEFFPEHSFVAVRYPQYPVAVAPPKGLKSSNVIAVPKEGELKLITQPDDLSGLMVVRLKELKNIDEKAAEKAVQAYLAIVQEVFQDGFYKFEIIGAAAQKGDDGAIKASGRCVVMQGGNGEVKVNLTIKPGGGISLGHSAKLRAGPRPRCQATKLLDDDPIVRYMAETELLFMGTPARPYLLEQRAKAAPGLRAAIDRILRKIEASGW